MRNQKDIDKVKEDLNLFEKMKKGYDRSMVTYDRSMSNNWESCETAEDLFLRMPIDEMLWHCTADLIDYPITDFGQEYQATPKSACAARVEYLKTIFESE